MSSIPTPFQPPSNGLFGLVVSSQEASEGLLKTKPSLFHKYHVQNVDGFDPLKWWASSHLYCQIWVFGTIDFGHPRFTNQNGLNLFNCRYIR
jgi:hypothetical protein